MSKRIALLCILDGLGLNPNPIGNAVTIARKPTLDKLFESCPHSTLVTFGERVGLPEGQMGNSEVGHLNIGAGRVVEQWLYRIGKALKNNYLAESTAYRGFLSSTKKSKRIHLIGLFSDGGVHSHREHLLLTIESLLRDSNAELAIHLLLDGRDTDPRIGLENVREFESWAQNKPRLKIASIAGRFYGMDRDNRWERTVKAVAALAGNGAKAASASAWIEDSYSRNISDEFVEPMVIEPLGIKADDGVLFYNFRADRMRQIVKALTQPNFTDFKRDYTPFAAERVLCFTDYDRTFGLPYLFEQINIENHLGEVLSLNGLRQLRVAETEKYPHVTYFFNGGVEKPYNGEDRKLIPSPRDVKTYDLKPEMSAAGVCKTVIDGINAERYDLIVVNFANPDMVGHTGVLEAAVKAVETVDRCLGEILDTLKSKDGQAIIIADHGNCEQMIDYETGAPHTAHTMFPVPVILFNSTAKGVISGGALSDIAPTILKMIGLQQPSEMTGRSLI